MNTIRTFTMASSVFAGLLAATLPALAQDAYNPDCGAAPMGPVSALVWDADNETFVARVVDISRVEMTSAAAPAPLAIDPAFDPNVLMDESLIGAGHPGAPKTLGLEPAS